MDLTEVCFAGAARQAELLRSGELTSRELVAECLRRIHRHDREVNAFRAVFDTAALAEADAADARRAAGGDAALLGVPIAVKEEFAIAGVPTTKGTDAVDTPAARDSEVVARLRAAGAVIVGSTRMPELGLWPYTESSWAGVTRNPWSHDHSPGGSSGGSAAAVAAGFVGGAIASDGAGSIRIPAACTGLYGLKPQRGRVSLAPEDQVWTGLVAAGPITRHVRDWALIADQISDSNGPAHPPRSSFTAAAAADPGRLRIAVSLRPWGPGIPLTQEVRDVVLDTASLLGDLGHDVVRMDPEFNDVAGSTAFAARYLHCAAISRAGVEHPSRLDHRTRQVAALGRRLPAGLVRKVIDQGERLTTHANRIFTGCDLLLTPALTRPPLRIGEWSRWSTIRALLAASRMTTFLPLWNITGNPAAAVPAGHTRDGLPLAVQLVGRPHDECTVLSVSGQLERARPWADRRPPAFA
ncbi:amidase [Umezawaea endophytica]|uniref:Amidase n=1 Tax=Umezawaea endophytica TaxID=1654476 RepID=A0A9X2VQV3_9PSEU|nr:amidase [Umezawaea endophytica]MCS7480517.1 amidase [Umezawaea endophytica]